MMRAALGFARLTVRNLFAGKRAIASAMLVLLHLLFVGLGAAKGAPANQIFQNTVFGYTLWLMLYLLSLVYGLALTSGEIEDGTVGYLYLGAVPKWLIVMIQVGVTTLVLSALLFLSLLLTALGASLGQGSLPHFWRDIGVCTLVGGTGILVSLAYYVTCGLAFRSPLSALAAALIPTFFWELMVTWWPIKFAAYTVTNNLRGLLLTLLFEGRRGDLYKYVRNFTLPTYGEAAMFLSVLAGVFLVAAMVAAMNRSIEGKEAR